MRSLLARHEAAGDLVAASSVSWLEIWRSLRRAGITQIDHLATQALSGVAEHPLSDQLLTRARTVGPRWLRSLDALHLASAIEIGAESMVTYDQRLAHASRLLGLVVLAPG